jgi:ferredoxin
MSEESATFRVRAGDGQINQVRVPIGERLMPALRAAGFPIEAICGGELSCGTCHIIVDEADYGRLPRPKDDEQTMLDFLPDAVKGRSRLSCQIIAAPEADGCTIEVPAT